MEKGTINHITGGSASDRNISIGLIKFIVQSSGEYTFDKKKFKNVLSFYCAERDSFLSIHLPITTQRLMLKLLDIKVSQGKMEGAQELKLNIKKLLSV